MTPSGLWSVRDQSWGDVIGRKANAAPPRRMAQVGYGSLPAPTGVARVAIIDVCGPLAKRCGWFCDTSTVDIRQALAIAVADPAVGSIVLRFDSPGGEVAGTDDLYRDVLAARDVKPVYAWCEDLCASAAYWIASGATKIVASPSCWLGGIGVFQVVRDWSGMEQAAGIKTIVVRSADFKGIAAGGAIDEAQLAELQREVSETAAIFTAAVTAGRGTAIAGKAVFDGRCWLAAEAATLGLCDEVTTWDQFIGGLMQQPAAAATPAAAKGRKPMSAKKHKTKAATPPPEEDVPAETEDTEDVADEVEADADAEETAAAPAASVQPASQPATLAQLKAELPDSTADFREMCQEAGLTLAQAKLIAATKAAAQPKRPGGPGVASKTAAGPALSGNFVEDVKQLAASMKAANPNLRGARRAAAAQLAAQNTEAHREWVEKQPRVQRS